MTASLGVLVEANFGVGVAFLTLAVPLAASAQWTAAAWALEGLALLWVGARQQRILPSLAGLALHAAGAVALLRALDTGAINTLPQFSGFTLNLVVFAATAFASAFVLARGIAIPEKWGRGSVRVADAAPWAMRFIGWMWVVLLVWQPLPYPWYVVAWCGVALALMVANRRRGDEALSPEWVAGVAIIVLAWMATEARAGAIAGFGLQVSVTTLLRFAVTVTAITAALLSLAGGTRQRTAAAALLALGVFVWLFALFAETWARIDDQWAAAQVALAIIGLTAALLVGLAHKLKWTWPLQLSWGFFVAHIVLGDGGCLHGDRGRADAEPALRLDRLAIGVGIFLRATGVGKARRAQRAGQRTIDAARRRFVAVDRDDHRRSRAAYRHDCRRRLVPWHLGSRTRACPLVRRSVRDALADARGAVCVRLDRRTGACDVRTGLARLCQRVHPG